MDPNALMRLIEGALCPLSTGDLYGYCSDLLRWLVRGGFAPEWNAYPRATKYLQGRIDFRRFVPKGGQP